MKEKYVIFKKQQKSPQFLKIQAQKPGGWYYDGREWHGPGEVLGVVELDLSEASSKGNAEFKPGDLVEVWWYHKSPEVVTYVETCPGRKTAKVMIDGKIHEFVRSSIAPLG